MVKEIDRAKEMPGVNYMKKQMKTYGTKVIKSLQRE